MKRRTLLASVGTVSGSLIAGCLDNTRTFRRTEYEECPSNLIFMDTLPNEVEEEVTTALEDGSYETDGDLYLTDIMGRDPESSYLRAKHIDHEGLYYQPVIETANGTTRLSIEEVIPTDSVSISLNNRSGTDISVSVRVIFEPFSDTFDDEVIIKNYIRIFAEKNATLVREPKYGRYSVEIEFQSTKRMVEDDWKVNETYRPSIIITDKKEVVVESSPGEPYYCEWDESGEVTY